MIKGVKYEGKPCIKCGSTLRYAKDKKCVECCVSKNKKYRSTKSGRETRKKISFKHYAKVKHGAEVNAEKTNKRRDLEDAQLLKDLLI